eukprot:TRINITY_DN568_c0_g2_i1.p1 TRINITY_DN568_c0_g2~~TRINITY_DN568_c0_g2_i1.p1  ORF type:complete len:245 (+),score=95.40 TRINITY_DN568_c0_g2_i1:310-1044(+)
MSRLEGGQPRPSARPSNLSKAKPAWSTVTIRKGPTKKTVKTGDDTVTTTSDNNSSSDVPVEKRRVSPTSSLNNSSNNLLSPPSPKSGRLNVAGRSLSGLGAAPIQPTQNSLQPPSSPKLSIAGKSLSGLGEPQVKERKCISYSMNGEPSGGEEIELDVKEEEDTLVIQALPSCRLENISVFLAGKFLRFEATHITTKKGPGGVRIKETVSISREAELPFTPTHNDLLFRLGPKYAYLEVVKPLQ